MAVKCSARVLLPAVQLSDLNHLLLLLPPHPLGIGMKVNWKDACEGINTISCALKPARQWVQTQRGVPDEPT